MSYWRINSRKRRLLTILVFPVVVTSALMISIFPLDYSDGGWCLSTIGNLIVYSLVMGWYLYMMWDLGVIEEWMTGEHRSHYLRVLEGS